MFFFVFKQKTAYEWRISDWSSDVCSSDLSKPLNIPPQTSTIASHLPKAVGIGIVHIGLRIDPGLPVDREVAHAGRGLLALAAIDALGVLAAGHLDRQSVV